MWSTGKFLVSAPTMTVDRCRHGSRGIPDVLQQSQFTYAAPMQYTAPAVIFSAPLEACRTSACDGVHISIACCELCFSSSCSVYKTAAFIHSLKKVCFDQILMSDEKKCAHHDTGTDTYIYELCGCFPASDCTWYVWDGVSEGSKKTESNWCCGTV